jgi:hypothetical protein
MTRVGAKSKAVCQKGAVLALALVLLLVMTVLAASVASMGSLELRMAGNAQNQRIAFDAAESGIELALAEAAYDVSAPVQIARTVIGDGETEATTEFRERTPVPHGFSIGIGIDRVDAFHFETESVGAGPRGAASRHTQEFYALGPTND